MGSLLFCTTPFGPAFAGDGLLRAIGAEGSHIRQSVIGEALVIGLIASIGGLFAGVALNAGLIALLAQMGAPFPDMDTIISTRTVGLAFAVGIGVTVLSALGPARQASRIAPVTAMRGASERTEGSPRSGSGSLRSSAAPPC